jgi:hypothetical protein
MAAPAAGPVFEIKDVTAHLTDKKLQNISSKAIDTAPAKTPWPRHRSLQRWNNLRKAALNERVSPTPSPALPSPGIAGLRFVDWQPMVWQIAKAHFPCETRHGRHQ